MSWIWWWYFEDFHPESLGKMFTQFDERACFSTWVGLKPPTSRSLSISFHECGIASGKQITSPFPKPFGFPIITLDLICWFSRIKQAYDLPPKSQFHFSEVTTTNRHSDFARGENAGGFDSMARMFFCGAEESHIANDSEIQYMLWIVCYRLYLPTLDYVWLISIVNVGTYTSPMDAMCYTWLYKHQFLTFQNSPTFCSTKTAPRDEFFQCNIP